MGAAKHDQMMREDNWHRYAEANGIRCEMCGAVIGYEERELVSERVCGHCKHVLTKDD